MHKCDCVCPDCELIDLRIGYIVCGVETDDGRNDGPGAEEPRGESCGFRARLEIDFACVLGRHVSLYRVAHGREGDLN